MVEGWREPATECVAVGEICVIGPVLPGGKARHDQANRTAVIPG
jgi:hypothetical protein